MEKIGPVVAIKRFFEQPCESFPDGGRKIEMKELQQLTADQRKELGMLCAERLGCELA